MRFAWLRAEEGRDVPSQTSGERLTLVIYNAVWWIPVVLPILGVISPRAGFMAFLAITVVRALVNAYRINVMPVAAGERLPLRQP